MGRFAVRLFIFGLAGVVSGCSTFEAMETALVRPEFTTKPATDNAAMPVYRVGDTFHFRIGDTLIKETVERIDGDGVWWRDNTGRRWIGGGGDIIPERRGVDIDQSSFIVSFHSLTVGESNNKRNKNV